MPSPSDMAREAQSNIDALRIEFDLLKDAISKLELEKLRERVAIIEEKVADLRKVKEESEKRHWQFVYIFVGAILTILCTVIVQLVLFQLKK